MTSWPPCWCLVHQSSRFSYVKKGSHAHPPDTPQRLGSKTSRLQNASVQIAILKTVRGVFAPEWNVTPSLSPWFIDNRAYMECSRRRDRWMKNTKAKISSTPTIATGTAQATTLLPLFPPVRLPDEGPGKSNRYILQTCSPSDFIIIIIIIHVIVTSFIHTLNGNMIEKFSLHYIFKTILY